MSRKRRAAEISELYSSDSSEDEFEFGHPKRLNQISQHDSLEDSEYFCLCNGSPLASDILNSESSDTSLILFSDDDDIDAGANPGGNDSVGDMNDTSNTLDISFIDIDTDVISGTVTDISSDTDSDSIIVVSELPSHSAAVDNLSSSSFERLTSLSEDSDINSLSEDNDLSQILRVSDVDSEWQMAHDGEIAQQVNDQINGHEAPIDVEVAHIVSQLPEYDWFVHVAVMTEQDFPPAPRGDTRSLETVLQQRIIDFLEMNPIYLRGYLRHEPPIDRYQAYVTALMQESQRLPDLRPDTPDTLNRIPRNRHGTSHFDRPDTPLNRIPRNRHGTSHFEDESYESLMSMAELIGNASPPQMKSQEIARLPVIKYVPRESTSTEAASCAICMNDFRRKQSLRVLNCFHQFHVDCIDKWLRSKAACPICRHNVTGHES